jgi:hypothetical protein
MTACALTGGKLAPEIDISETSENEWGCLLALISCFRRDVVIIDDSISGAIVISEVWVDDIGGFLAAVRYSSIMETTFLMGTKFVKLLASSSRMRYASTTGPASNQLRHGSNALDLCQS